MAPTHPLCRLPATYWTPDHRPIAIARRPYVQPSAHRHRTRHESTRRTSTSPPRPSGRRRCRCRCMHTLTDDVARARYVPIHRSANVRRLAGAAIVPARALSVSGGAVRCVLQGCRGYSCRLPVPGNSLAVPVTHGRGSSAPTAVAGWPDRACSIIAQAQALSSRRRMPMLCGRAALRAGP
jgi:hypothetical protein